MTYLLFLFAALAAGGCAFSVMAFERTISDWMILWMFVSIALGVVAFLTACFAVAIPVSAGYDKRQCYRYEELTGREVNYKRFSYWTWDCYVRTKSGNWVSKDQIRGVDQ